MNQGRKLHADSTILPGSRRAFIARGGAAGAALLVSNALPQPARGQDVSERPSKRRAPTYPDHIRMVVARDADGNEHAVKTPLDWLVRREHILAHVQSVMGPLPGGERRVPLEVRVEESREKDGIRIERVSYMTEPDDRVESWLLTPLDDATARPAMLCLHQTTSIGKDEPAGFGGLPNLHYAAELARRGYVTLSPGYPGFGSNNADVYALGY